MTKYIKRKKKSKGKFTIVYDDREKNPWLFLKGEHNLKRKRLNVGDYSIEGYEDKIAVEKKSGLAELFSNLAVKTRPRFQRFLSKMSAYPIKVIIVEQPLTNATIAHTVWILKHSCRMRMTAKTIHIWTAKIIIDYGIPIIFTDAVTSAYIVKKVFSQCISKLEELK